MGYFSAAPSSHDTSSLLSHKRRSRFTGWRGGFVVAIGGASVVLVVNITCAIVTATRWDANDGIATAYEGDCKIVSRWATTLHLVINVLSSLLLGASSYCMQRLVAPTRREIDRAHAKGQWMDVGMPSLRNLGSIDRKRLVLWTLLALSSVPLHFLYNSVVIQTISSNYVDILFVRPEFFTARGGWMNNYRDYGHAYYQQIQDTLLNGQYLDRTKFENITAVECVTRYSAPYINSGNGFGVLIPSLWDAGTTGGMLANSTLLGTEMGTSQVLEGYQANHLSYCLSEILPERCQLQFSQSILYIVIVCNVIKVVLMVTILWKLNQETIVTVGDAIKSFIQQPDHTTEDCCLISSRTVAEIWIAPEERHSQQYQPKPREPWWGAVSRRRWIFSLSIYTVMIATAVGLYARLVTRGGRCDGETCPSNGFGNVDWHYLLSVHLGSTSVVPYVLLANLPQFLVSICYLSYNGIFTAMLANREWANYASKRAALRVTAPSPTQRSSYFLSLPFTYSVPLLIASILLHWFISQSLFVARFAIYQNGVVIADMNNFTDQKSGSDLGFSDLAFLATIVWGCVMVAACLFISALCTYTKGLPIGGTNSAVISAACHVRYAAGEEQRVVRTQYVGAEESKVEEDLVDRPLQWGVTIEATKDLVGHCCFSDQEVEKPEVGCLYAGFGTKSEVM